MGFGIEGTPFYIPDPRKPEEVLEAVYMHTGVVALGSAVYVYEVARLSTPVRPGVYRMASHRTAGLSKAAIRRLAMRETTKFTITGAASLFGLFHPVSLAIEGMLLAPAVFPQYAARAYQSAMTGQPSVGSAALSTPPASSWSEFFSLDFWTGGVNY